MTFRPSRLAFAIALAVPSYAAAQDAPIVQPGAPGAESRLLAAEEAAAVAGTRFTEADIGFMRDMIPHHAQATAIAALVEGRSTNEDLARIAERIDATQDDEIAFMREWLTARGRMPAVDHTAMGHGDMDHAAMGHAAAGSGAHATMKGMVSPAQMAALAAAEGAEFDRQFLTLMIAHHDGAIGMVDDLLEQPGSAYDPVLFEFATDIKAEQEKEIRRMNTLLARLAPDPRASLAAGFRDAGEAIEGLELVATLPRPPGFFDPANPADLPPVIEREDDDTGDDGAEEALAEEGLATEGADDGERETQWGERSPLLSFAQTDMAFAGDLLAVGNYHGFNLYDIADRDRPRLVSSVVCPGGQGDVSIAGDLLVMSVEQTRARVDCGLQGVAEDISPDRFRGLRIFDISDRTRPRQVGQVQTCRGSHTHSIVEADDTRLVVYNSGTAGVREDEELAGCIGAVPGDERTALFSIDVIEIPVANPAAARIVDSPRVFADAETGRIAGLWARDDHGEDTQTTAETNHCHDITVFPALDLAAGACSGNGILLDISDPLAPKRIDDVTDPGFAYWHSATFNHDGTKVLFTDEWGGGARPRCRAWDRTDWGADAFYDIEDRQLQARGKFKIPAPQTDEENCVAHNGSIVPVPGRDIFVQAWYQGGISVIDFTDSANPVEIAYFDRGPLNEEKLVLGGYWSAYWYDGRIYGTEIVRGLDVFRLEPSEHLTAEEIAAAEAARYPGGVFNPQTQTMAVWPEEALRAVEESRAGG